MAARTGYSRLQITLHWLTAVLILGAWITHDDMGRALRQRIETGTTGVEGNTLHVWLGGAAFAVIVIRLLVRAVQGGPEPHGSVGLRLAAVWGHRLIYALMLLVPALGAAAWYGHVGDAAEVHEVAGQALMIVALGHAVMAMWHQIVVKDGTLRRMMRADTA